jgi:hypothetical protein
VHDRNDRNAVFVAWRSVAFDARMCGERSAIGLRRDAGRYGKVGLPAEAAQLRRRSDPYGTRTIEDRPADPTDKDGTGSRALHGKW